MPTIGNVSNRIIEQKINNVEANFNTNFEVEIPFMIFHVHNKYTANKNMDQYSKLPILTSLS